MLQSLVRDRVEAIAKVNRGRLGYIAAQVFGEHGRIVGENLRFVRRARDGDICEPLADEFRVNFGIHIYQHALCGKPLRALRGHGVAMIEVAHRAWVERNALFFVAIHANDKPAVVADLLECAKIAVGNAQLPVWRRQLYPVRTANGEPFCCAPRLSRLKTRLTSCVGFLLHCL